MLSLSEKMGLLMEPATPLWVQSGAAVWDGDSVVTTLGLFRGLPAVGAVGTKADG